MIFVHETKHLRLRYFESLHQVQNVESKTLTRKFFEILITKILKNFI